MKTKDFIKMLQKEDPSGEAYIRLPYGGAIIGAEHKPGYWDGAYSFYDKETHKMHTTTLGSKVDIYVRDYSDIVWDENGDFEKVKERIVLDHSNFSYKEHQDEKDNRIWKSIIDECKMAKGYDDAFLKEWYSNVLDKYYYEEDFIEVRQPLDIAIGKYHSMTAHTPDAIPIQLNQGECGILIRSGNFYPEKTNDYYIWKHDPDKGKDWSL